MPNKASKEKYQWLISKREKQGINHFNDSKPSIEYTNDIDDIYQKIEEYYPSKKREILIVFDDKFAYMHSTKNCNLIVTEL